MSGESVPVTLPTVFTIGYSTRDLDTFIQMLRVHGVTHLVDVRTIPRSRHNPQFNCDTLPEGLRLAGIAYTHIEELGGLRHARPDSRTPAGTTPRSGVSPITCKRRNSKPVWRSSCNSRHASKPSSCAPRRFPGAVI